MFNEDQLKLLTEFYYHCEEFTPTVEESSASWCQSYYQYEVLQGLILGREKYLLDALPTWLKDRPKYRTGPIQRHIQCKLDTFKVLQEIKSLSDYLVVCEVGYGTDIIVAIMIKEWKEIYCYDNPYMEKGLIDFFVKKKGVNLIFKQSPSTIFDFAGIDKRTIVLANHTHIPVAKQGKNIKDNDNLIYVSNGIVLDNIPVTVEECRKNTKRGYL